MLAVRWTRHLIPRLQSGSWGGTALTDDGSPTGDEVSGGHLTVQWFGLLIEIGVGAIGRRR